MAVDKGFLENLQGLTTLKIYQADEKKAREMDEESQRFRQITMKVLTMQLNSTSVMDIVAYGGAAAGMIVASLEFLNGHLSFAGALTIIRLASEFFIPLRLLGSFFHIAMNGMAASDKIFHLLDLRACYLIQNFYTGDTDHTYAKYDTLHKKMLPEFFLFFSLFAFLSRRFPQIQVPALFLICIQTTDTQKPRFHRFFRHTEVISQPKWCYLKIHIPKFFYRRFEIVLITADIVDIRDGILFS